MLVRQVWGKCLQYGHLESAESSLFFLTSSLRVSILLWIFNN
jgi:hypothetical protein